MLIFRFEWKRKRKYILIWAATLAVCIFSMTPVYYGMIETVETLLWNLHREAFLKRLVFLWSY